MDSIIKNSFEFMCSKYSELLTSFYPARGSTGFTEQNQVHIYVNALSQSLDDPKAVEWLEFPWKNKNEHIDALVYSPKHKACFFIEAKRLIHRSKSDDIVADVKRIANSNKNFLVEHKIKNYQHEYIIALSDVWFETDWKRSRPAWWFSGEIPEQILKWNQNLNERLTLVQSDTFKQSLLNIPVNFTEFTPYGLWIGENIPAIRNYCLLMAAIKI